MNDSLSALHMLETPCFPPQSRSSTAWLDLTLMLAALLACAVAVSPNLADPDLWGHVTYGRDVLRGGLPETTTYAYSTSNYPWINHENLAELVLAVAADTVGPVGMMGAKCFLGLTVIGVIAAGAYRRGAGLLAVCVVALLVATNLSYFWSMRPQLASFVLYGLQLALLGWCFAGWEGRCWIGRTSAGASNFAYSPRRLRLLWLAPLLFCLWANSHGGFVAGFCIFTAYLGLRGIESWLVLGGGSWKLWIQFAALVAASAAATLVNPYGPDLHRWLYDSLGSPRPEILEWHAPDLTSPLMIPLWVMMSVWFLSMALSRRSSDVTHTVILALTLWQALQHVRHVPFFAIAFGFWVAPHVDSVLRRFQLVTSAATAGGDLTPRMRTVFGTTMVLACALISGQLVNRFSMLRVDREQYPVAAFQYIAEQNLRGKMVVTFNWAQYGIAAFGAEHESDEGIRVSFDGRFRTCYPQHVVDMNFDFVLGDSEPRFRGAESPPFDEDRVLTHGQPDLVLISRHQPHSVQVMSGQSARWVLLYQDQIAQLWGRRDRYADPASRDFLPSAARHVGDDVQQGMVAWPALPSPSTRPPTFAANR